MIKRVVVYEADQSNKTIGTLIYRYERSKSAKVKTIRVPIGCPAVMTRECVQSLLVAAFNEMYRLVEEIK